jgi:5-methylcytosine-specific restriction protein A
MSLGDITGAAVEQAIHEYDELGRHTFLKNYGFGRSRQYFLVHGDRAYDSKAILGAAHGFLPGRKALTPKDFSGGVNGHAVDHLRALGFEVRDTLGPEGPEQPDAPALSVDAPAAMDPTELIDRVLGLRVNRSSGRPALFQPITLLWAIGRARRGEPRLLPWRETERRLTDLLVKHGENPRPDYPVAALHHARLWHLEGFSGDVPKAHGSSQPRRWFSEQQPVGGLVESVYRAFRDSGPLSLSIVETLLETYLENRDSTQLLLDTGLSERDAVTAPDRRAAGAVSVDREKYVRLCEDVEESETATRGRRAESTVRRPMRLAKARTAVLERCGGRCENPACSGQPDDVTDADLPILQVDHIEPIAEGGRDHPVQMIALCPNCHAMKTLGRKRAALAERLLRVAQERHAALVTP